MPDTSAHRRAVTVVIPAHGVANYVVGSVASALAQPEATKVVVVDDRSPDEGAALVRGHFDDPRLEVISSERTPGVCGARNAGLERVGTEWVLFLDGDDELIEGALGRLMAAATPRAAGVFGSFRHVTETGEDHPSISRVDEVPSTAAHPPDAPASDLQPSSRGDADAHFLIASLRRVGRRTELKRAVGGL